MNIFTLIKTLKKHYAAKLFLEEKMQDKLPIAIFKIISLTHKDACTLASV